MLQAVKARQVKIVRAHCFGLFQTGGGSTLGRLLTKVAPARSDQRHIAMKVFWSWQSDTSARSAAISSPSMLGEDSSAHCIIVDA